MSAPPHDSKEASSFQSVLVAALALVTAALAIAVWQQRAEIRRLAPRPLEPLAPGVALHLATARNLVLASPRADRTAGEPMSAMDDAREFAPSLFPRTARPRPVNPSPLARLLNNPEFFQALALHRQATLDTRFAGLFRRLDLDADELAAFKHLLAEKDNIALDVVAIGEAQPDGPMPGELLNASVAAARAQVEDAIRASLGSERYAVYRDYEDTLPQRTVIAQLEQRLSYSPTPLSPAQSDSLVRILVAHAPPPAAADTPRAATVVVGATAPVAEAVTESHAATAVVTNDVIAEAQTLLAPNQVAAFREIQTEQQASARALQLIRENLPGGDRSASTMLNFLLQ